MNDKLRKFLILQLCFIELFLLVILFKKDKNNCDKLDNDVNLLVYDYNNTLLSPLTIKDDKMDIDIIDDIDNLDEIEEVVEIEEEIEEIEEVVVEDTITYSIPSDVDFEKAWRLVEYAKQFVGNPYVYGGNSLTEGTDCSGFTKLIYQEFGIDLPRVAVDQSYVGVEVSLSSIQIGDLVLSGYEGKTHHVAIYIGDNKIVHALNASSGIVITNLYIMPITHVRRVIM